MQVLRKKFIGSGNASFLEHGTHWNVFLNPRSQIKTLHILHTS